VCVCVWVRCCWLHAAEKLRWHVSRWVRLWTVLVWQRKRRPTDFFQTLNYSIGFRLNLNSLSYSFPLVLRVHVRGRAISRGKVKGYIPLKTKNFRELTWNHGVRNAQVFSHKWLIKKIWPSCFVLYTIMYIYLQLIYVVYCWNVFKNRYFAMLGYANITLLSCTISPTFQDHSKCPGFSFCFLQSPFIMCTLFEISFSDDAFSFKRIPTETKTQEY